MKLKELHIKAKECVSLTSDFYISLPIIKQAKLLSNHYVYKRRKLNKDVLDTFFSTMTPRLLMRIIKRLPDDNAKRKLFRSIRNIDSDILNEVLLKYSHNDLFQIINCLKLEDRRKIRKEVLDKLSAEKLVLLINEHFSSFGKLAHEFFTDYVTQLDPEILRYIIVNINPRYLPEFFKRTGLDDMGIYVKAMGLTSAQRLMDSIKGDVKAVILRQKKNFLIRKGKRNKRNVLVVNKDLFKNIDLLNIEIELKLHSIKLKQRKHITSLIDPLFHNIKLLNIVVGLPKQSIENIVAFLEEYRELDFVYDFICAQDIIEISRVSARQYSKVMQGIFDLFYRNFMFRYMPKKEGDTVFKRKVQRLVACRFLEYNLEYEDNSKIAFLFQFDTYLDDHGRALLGYYHKNGSNLELRPTIKQNARSFVRFRPRLNGTYDVFKINAKGKILDYVPVRYQITDSRFQHMASGYTVASFVKNLTQKPNSFRSYLTADSKLYFGKIENEVVQTLIGYLEGATPVECTVKRHEGSFALHIYIFNSQTGRFEYRDPVRSILLRGEKPYFKELLYDFSPEKFLEMDKRSFNSVLRYFKNDYFSSFYEKLNIDQKKEIFEKLTSKGENSLIDKIGEDVFAADIEKLSLTFGDEFESISDLVAEKMEVDEGYAFTESRSRRSSDQRVLELSDLDDESFFALNETARLDEFGFDFVSYPPELTFQIKHQVLEKIYESFPQDLRRYIKIHADEIDEDIQEKILEINTHLLDGIPLGKKFAVRKDPLKRAFIDDLIRLLEDHVSYDTINDIIVFLRSSQVRILQDTKNRKYRVSAEVIAGILDKIEWDKDDLTQGLSVTVIERS
ncbi:MAG: hypothetical protein RBU23_05850 [Candidatus Auribacterota bacterium]|jgi:hypothetical protein|nr:hypothetical protein [Candidatus Auribacterota bacterium]